ncbi:MAG: DUF5711 family protein [Clostridia bacterium]|nr:DUF5711 family protein [Clostridia bacterium]
MSHSEEDVKVGSTGGKSNVIVFFLLLLLIAGVAFLVYLKSQNFDFKSVRIQDIFKNSFHIKAHQETKQKDTVIPCDEKEKYAFTTYKDNLIKCTRDTVTGIDKSGNELWSVPISMSNPKVKKSSADLLVYDLGGREVVIINGKSVKWNKKLDNNIINADISESGYVSIVQELKGYKAAVSVFNLQGNEFFTRSDADNFVLGAQVSPNGKYVAVHMLDMSGGVAGTSISFMNMLGTPFAARVPKNGEVFPSLWYLKEDLLVGINDSSVFCMDRTSKEQKEKWKQEFKDRIVYSSAASSGKLFIAVSGGEKAGLFNGASTEIKVLNADGKQAAQFLLHDKVINLKAYGDVAAVNAGREVYLINSRGKLVGKYTSKMDVNEVHFFNKQELAVVSKNNVVITKIEQ